MSLMEQNFTTWPPTGHAGVRLNVGCRFRQHPLDLVALLLAESSEKGLQRFPELRLLSPVRAALFSVQTAACRKEIISIKISDFNS